jgi:hypothetical protein
MASGSMQGSKRIERGDWLLSIGRERWRNAFGLFTAEATVMKSDYTKGMLDDRRVKRWTS